MINPGDIVAAFVGKLQQIPQLVALQGTSGTITGYHPTFATATNFRKALHASNPGDILVRWLGTGPGSFGENRVWKHQIGVYVRPYDTTADDSPSSHYEAMRLIVDGNPPGEEKLLNQQILPDLDPMDIPTAQTVTDSEGLEYFLITFAIPEIGDN
jgi:hypothetical protein